MNIIFCSKQKLFSQEHNFSIRTKVVSQEHNFPVPNRYFSLEHKFSIRTKVVSQEHNFPTGSIVLVFTIVLDGGDSRVIDL